MAIETEPTYSLPESWTPRTEIDEIVIPAFVDLKNTEFALTALEGTLETVKAERSELQKAEYFWLGLRSARVKKAVTVIVSTAVEEQVEREYRDLQSELSDVYRDKYEQKLIIATELHRGTITATPLNFPDFKKERQGLFSRALVREYHTGPITGDVIEVDDLVHIRHHGKFGFNRNYISHIRPIYADRETKLVEQDVSFSRAR